MPKGFKETRLFSRNQVIAGPFLCDDGVIVGAARLSIIKFDRATVGTQLWETPAGSTWLVDAVDGVVLGARNGGTTAHFEADGRLAWDADGDGYVSRVEGSVAIVSGATIEIREPGSGTIRRTLNLAWRATGAATACGTALVVTNEVADPMATTVDEQRMSLIDSDTGATLWDRPLGRECNKLLALAQEGESRRLLRAVYGRRDSLVIKFGRGLFRLDLATGEVLWHAPVQMDVHELAVIDDRAFVAQWHGLSIVDMRTGQLLLNREYPELQSSSHPRPGVVRGNRIAFPCESGHIVVYDVDGNLINVRKANARFWAGVEADGRLILAGSGALVVCEESIWGQV
jgi:outer membrane protein assembly factor BamB